MKSFATRFNLDIILAWRMVATKLDESKLIRFAANFEMLDKGGWIFLLIFARQERSNKNKFAMRRRLISSWYSETSLRFLLILCECWDIYQQGLMCRHCYSRSYILAFPVRACLRICGISSCCQLRVVPVACKRLERPPFAQPFGLFAFPFAIHPVWTSNLLRMCKRWLEYLTRIFDDSKNCRDSIFDDGYCKLDKKIGINIQNRIQFLFFFDSN